MAQRNCLTLNSTGQIIEYGFVTLVAGGGQTLHTNVTALVSGTEMRFQKIVGSTCTVMSGAEQTLVINTQNALDQLESAGALDLTVIYVNVAALPVVPFKDGLLVRLSDIGDGSAGFAYSIDGVWKIYSGNSDLPLPNKYLTGLNLEWNSISQIQITPGNCRDTTNTCNIELTSTKTATITTVGVGGLQTSSSEAASTWYKVLLIGDSLAVNPDNVLLVPEGTAFLESGYDVFRLVAYIRNDSGSDFLKLNTTNTTGPDKFYSYDELYTDLQVFSQTNMTKDSPQTITMTSYVPPISRKCMILSEYDGDTDQDVLSYREPGSSILKTPLSTQEMFNSGSADQGLRLLDNIPLSTGQTCQVTPGTTDGAASTMDCTVYIAGYYISL